MIEILTQSAVMTVIAGIKTSATKLQAEIHQAAVSCLDHVRQHGDTRGALALVTALPNGQRVQGLIEWFRGFSNGKVSFKKDQSGALAIVLQKERVDSDFDIESAMATDFGAFTKEAKPRSLTVDALIKMIEQKANNTELNADSTPKVTPEARAVAASLVGAYRKAAANVVLN